MSSIKLKTVCSFCFSSSSNASQPKLSTEQCKNRNEMVCKRCRKKWSSINVTQSPAENTWYHIRARPNKHKTIMCKAILNSKQCATGVDCKFPHNFFEKEVWESATENSPAVPSCREKYYCFVCKLSFQTQSELSGHMNSFEHEKSAEKMRVLPSVGSNMDFKGTVRDRPNLSLDADEYQMCEDVAKGFKCRYKNACKYAHSIEERIAWNEALQAELLMQDTEDVFSGVGQDNNWQLEGDTRRGTCVVLSKRDSTPSTPQGTPTRVKHKGKLRGSQTSITSPTGNPSLLPTHRNKKIEPLFIKGITRTIAKNSISSYLNAVPKHIRLQCDKSTDVSINSTETQEVVWNVRLSCSTEEQLHAVVLYNHKKCFRIAQLMLGDTQGDSRQLQTQLYSNNTGCILDINLSSSKFIEVSVVFRPQKGEYSLYIVFQLIYGTLIAYKIQVRVVEERFVAPTAEFNELVQQEKMSIQQMRTHMNVLWEQEYRIVLFSGQRDGKTPQTTKHAIPARIEGRIASGAYNSMTGTLTAECYKERFHSLLHLEEYEHRKRLVKYDLTDYKVTFETAVKEVSYSYIEGDKFKAAPDNFRFITFKLKYNLFEGYRSYKPPTNAFVIPNDTHTAYECSHLHTGLDFMHFQISETAVAVCEKSGGLALVRFMPDRDEYVRMHEALDKIDPCVMFPKLKKVSIRSTWDEKSILAKAEKEKLSESQKVAINSIINTKFQTFPTLICGPFGCGKTRTLAIAARLVALNYHGSRVLIVTRNNSCANLCIEEISRGNEFDSISSYRDKMTQNPGSIHPILFRHFAKATNLGRNKKVIEFTQFNYEKGAKMSKMLKSEELLICGIVVTTTHGCYSLIQLGEQLGADAQPLFTHVFIDEAAQIIEPEACIPLHFASPDTKVVLAGDTCQTRPLVLSPLAVKHSMDRSVLERYYEFKEYESDALSVCRVELRENFRSQEPIVRFLSRLFYNDSITANPPEVSGPHKLPYMSMVHANGEEKRIELYGHVSYCNEIEGQQTMCAVQRFVDAGVDPSRIVVLSTYRRQLKLIETYLRGNGTARCKRLGHNLDRKGDMCRQSGCVNERTIEYSRLEGIQGLEYDVLIINTVRTIHEAPKDSSLETRLDLGLLDDLTQFNTILTRARGWVMVIGDTECLTEVGGCSEMWRQYVQACKEQGGYFPQGNIEHGTHDRMFERDRKCSEGENAVGRLVGRESVSTRLEEKKSLLESFVSICKEELKGSNDNFSTKHIISEQLDLVETVRQSVEKQSKQSKDLIQQFNQRNINKYTQHSYPTNPSPRQQYRPQVCYDDPITSSYAGAVNRPQYTQIPNRPYMHNTQPIQIPNWTTQLRPTMGVYPPRGFNQQSRDSYY